MDRNLYRTLLLLAGLSLVLWAFGLILWPFLSAISWALCIVAVTIRPYYALVRRWRKPRLAAAVMTIATAVTILAPLALAVLLVVGEVRHLSEAGFGDVFDRLRASLPGLYADADRLLARFETSLSEVVSGATQSLNRWLPSLATDVVGGLAGALFSLLVMLGTQYFVYRDAGRLKALVRDLLPMPDAAVDRVLETLHRTTVSALVGGVLVAVAQGALGSIGLWIVGVRAPVTWGFLMALCSFIPVGGTALIWAPVALFLLATGEIVDGVFLLAYGGLILSTSDNLLRPWILGKMGSEGIHPLLLFFAILSGIGLFGVSGILFGPLLIALLTTLTRIYRERVVPVLREPLEAGGPGSPPAPPREAPAGPP